MKNNQQIYVSPKINVLTVDQQDVISTSTLKTDGLTAKLSGGSSERTPWVG